MSMTKISRTTFEHEADVESQKIYRAVGGEVREHKQEGRSNTARVGQIQEKNAGFPASFAWK